MVNSVWLLDTNIVSEATKDFANIASLQLENWFE
jgi:predicted nucleic acid-binding protein